MQKAPKALRVHIGIFGRRNVGKSSVLNVLIGQQRSIVSDVAGTTTDPVEKVMELQPIGPVVFIDTAGIDDVGALGEMRVKQSMKVIERTDVAIIVSDDWQDYEKKLYETRSAALQVMQEHAAAMNANAVVGVDVDYENFNTVLMISVSGTAVVVE